MVYYNQLMENKQIKLTSDEISELVALNNEYQEILIGFGQCHVRRQELEHEEVAISDLEKTYNASYEETQKNEINFKQRISRKYGDGEIDLQSGTYTKS